MRRQAKGKGTIDGSNLTDIDGSADDVVQALADLGVKPANFNTVLESGVDQALDIASIALANGTGTIDGSKLTGIDGSADDVAYVLLHYLDVKPTNFNTVLEPGVDQALDISSIASANGAGTSWIATTGVTLSGSAGNQTVTGSKYADHITGGAGDDNLTGGAGADTFTYVAGANTTAAAVAAANGADTITDFKSSDGDVLGVAALLGNPEAFVKGELATLSGGDAGANNVVVITDTLSLPGALKASDVDNLASFVSTYNGSGILVFNNNGTVEVWYDADMGTDSSNGGTDVVLIGTITTTGAAADLANLTAANFA